MKEFTIRLPKDFETPNELLDYIYTLGVRSAFSPAEARTNDKKLAKLIKVICKDSREIK